ncbi:MAG: hypothetical protein EOO14_24695 [Chitinophagaceae bacterium]|nr:MAG: hypothetical protein EOO14_24695 [Chitinophagaceae bacterium]
MKKLLVTIALLVYFTVSTGFVVSVHYCMDRLNGLEWGESDAEECGKCGMPTTDSDGCCKDEVKVVKLDVDHTYAKQLTADFSLHLPALTPVNYLFTPSLIQIATEEPVAHGPPLSEQDTYLLNRVFRI